MTGQDGGFSRATLQRKISVLEVRSAIHVRTGECAVVEALDGWLARHHVETTALADAYEACVHLITQYEHIPDLALIGADWLADEEFNIVAYIRQTWPHTGIVVYGRARELPLAGLLPMMLTCQTEAALKELLAGTPAEVLQHLWKGSTRPTTLPAPYSIPATGQPAI